MSDNDSLHAEAIKHFTSQGKRYNLGLKIFNSRSTYKSKPGLHRLNHRLQSLLTPVLAIPNPDHTQHHNPNPKEHTRT
jgi:hypothetical protein